MHIRNVPKNLPIYLRRAYYARSNSAPFISGDFFADISDVSFFDYRSHIKVPLIAEISDARVIFCTSDNIERMIEDFGPLIYAKVLIIGNGDRDFESFNIRLPSSIKRVFLQNQNFESSLIEPLPIGLENLRLGKNGLVKYFQSRQVQTHKVDKVLVGPYSPTHPERTELLQAAKENSRNLILQNDYILPAKYTAIASAAKFVACPRGNGFDTHRFWETLYRGSIPIVKESIWSNYFSSKRVPLVQVDDWKEINSQFSSRSKELNGFDPKKIPIVWSDYWLTEIKKYL